MKFNDYIVLSEALEDQNPSMNVFLTEGVIEILKRIVNKIKKIFIEFLNTTFKEKADRKFLEQNPKLKEIFLKLANIEYDKDGKIINVQLRPLASEDFIRKYITLWREFKKLNIDVDFPKIEINPSDMVAPSKTVISILKK